MTNFYTRTSVNLKTICLVSWLLNLKLILGADFKMEHPLKDFKHISNSCSYFSTNLFQALTTEQNDNIISSPLSSHIILSLLFHGSNGATREELESTLHLLDSNQSQTELKNLFTALNTIENAELEMANVMFVDNNFMFRQEFLTTSQDNFQTSIKKINFMHSENSAELINAWVKEKTKGKISHIINPNAIDGYTKVMLINALYFKSHWLHPFESLFTEKKKFHNIDGTETLIPTMFQKFSVPHGYIESLHANFIKLKYLSPDFEMIIILPNEKYTLTEIERKFDWDLISKATYSTKEVELFLPKFKIEATVNLKTTLQKLGIKLMFEERANFSLIAEKPLHVSQVLQKLFIEVDEKGSEATVVTAAQMRTRRMIVDYETFVVDHPFMFIIQHKPSSIPLFVASIRKLGETALKDEL